MNTQELITRCTRNDRQAEKELFLRYAGKVLTLCRRYVRDEHLAQDYVQECFIQVFAQLEKFDDTKGEFDGWMYRVCTNVVLQQLRKLKREVQVHYLDVLPENDNVEELVETLSHEEILEGVRQLPLGYRQVFNLYYFEGWSHREIGVKLGIKEKSSQSQLTRAKRMLRLFLEKKIKKNYEKRTA